jgi:sulfur carrier protein
VITVNGEPRDVAAGTPIEAVVATLTPLRSGVAVALNDSVVPRAAWATTVVEDDDRLEVLTAVQGG